MKEEIPERIQLLLKSVVDVFDREDPFVRERQIRLYKKLKFYWAGFQHIYWDSVAHDWRLPEDWANSNGSSDAAYYDKPVNIFRAYLESIIAALSVSIPNIRCLPDDPDNPLDISTAKAGNKIYELVSKHIDAPLLWLEALYISCTEGLVHAYHYPKEDEKYGTYDEKEYKTEEIQAFVCPECGAQVPDELLAERQKDKFDPDADDVALDSLLSESEAVCPECAAQLDLNLQKSPLIITRMVGVNRKPKSRICLEVYGGLFVKTPTYAKKQEDMPYLCYSYECHYAEVIGRYKALKGKVNRDSTGGYDSYERWGRASTQYRDTFPIDLVTVRNWWFRPCAFNVLEEADAAEMKKLYPFGVRMTQVNDQFAEAEPEALDDYWTLTRNPLSDYIQFDPLGLLLVSSQDIINDLNALTLQTIEQGITQTFVDPAVLDLDAYSKNENTPGAVYATKPVAANRNIGDGFYQLKAANLSTEVMPFGAATLQGAQVVSGALPSIFGGDSASGSKTASEYAMSRGQALQRLQTTYKMFQFWWKNVFGKVIPAYMEEMVEDEHFTKVDKSNNNYIKVVIKKAEIGGKLGDVELESSDQLPLTWSQKRDIMKELFGLQIPEIMQALTSPENLPMVKEAYGLDEFVMPGENDRQKEYEEIQKLVESEPIEQPAVDPMTGLPSMDPITGQPAMQQVSSVPIDPDLDNHAVCANIDRYWLTGEIGRQTKVDNIAGYTNVLLHYKEHMQQQMQAQMMAESQAATETPSNNGDKKKQPESPKAPTKDIAAKTGEGNGNRFAVQ